MTPDEWLPDETRAWVHRAGKDLRAAELCEAELPAEALYHCQQAAEKLLKAFLTWNQTAFRKTHEIRELPMACVQIDATLEPALEPAAALSQYAWRFRYPGEPYEPDADEAARGRALAEQVRAEILRRLPKAATND
jgi:HEPN domain-containing protein